MKPKKSPQGKGKGSPKGQGTLFSFFSKTPAKEPPTKSKEKEKEKETPTKPKPSHVTTPSTAGASPEQPSKDSEKLLGKRIKVFWRDDNNWYFGKVIDYEDGKHLIHYDDGDKEKLVLKNEKVVDRAKEYSHEGCLVEVLVHGGSEPKSTKIICCSRSVAQSKTCDF